MTIRAYNLGKYEKTTKVEKKKFSNEQLLNHNEEFKINDIIGSSKIKNINHKIFDKYFGVNPNFIDPVQYEINDLLRLHKICIDRKVTTILEFGVGYSTLVLAKVKLSAISFCC